MKKITTIILSLLFLSSGAFAQIQIQNPGFESWEDAGTVEDEPVNWNSIKTSDDPFYNNLAPVVWGRSDDAHSGNYSLSLFNVGSLVIATGTICNGRYHTQLPADSSYVFTDPNDDQWNSPINARPDSVVGWYKCNATEGDHGTIKFMLHNGYAKIPGDEDASIAIAQWDMPTIEITEWTRFSIPFVYTSNETPQYYLSILTSGNGVDALLGSTAKFDDLEFIYNGNSVSELPVKDLSIYLKNSSLVINPINNNNNNSKPFEFSIQDINGKVVYSSKLLLTEMNSIDISNLNSGIYIATASNSDVIYMNKVMILK